MKQTMETVTSATDTQSSTSNLLFCRACQSVYQQPKLLPCLHSFCRPCLVHAVTNGSDGSFIVCPLCSHKSQLPAIGVVGVPDNLFLNRMCQFRTPEFSQPVEDEDTVAEQSPASGQPFDRGLPAGRSTVNALEAIRNMNKLQTKRRTTQFQFYLKRMEHQLISQIDSKQTDDLFYTETDKAKAELKKILNNILHEVNVLKNIQELGKDAEINSLSPILLGSSVGMAEVALKKLHFDLEVPNTTIEEIVGDNFGVIRFNSEESKVFVPEVSDLGDFSVGNVTQLLAGTVNVAGNVESKGNFVKENEEPENVPTGKTPARRSADRRSRRHNTDLGLDKPDVKEFLAQFQNARENLRARRKEILERGRQASEDALPLGDEIYRRPRSTSRTGRVQSVDRAGLPVSSKRRATLPSGLTLQEVKSLNTAEPETLSPTLQEEVSPNGYDPTEKIQHGLEGDLSIGGLGQEDQFSLRKKLQISTYHQRTLVKQSSDPRYTRESPTSPEEVPSSERLYSGHSQFSNPSNTIFERRFSDQLNPLPLEETDDSLQYDRATTRPVRRAFSGAADRKAKIDFLRENWQKRKEILIQSEGFVSPDTTKQVVKPPSQVHLAEEKDDSKVTMPETVEATGQDNPSPPPVSSSDPKFESMHAIRSRVAQYRTELTKNNITDEQEVKAKTPDSPSSPISEHFRFDLPRQKYISQTQLSPVLKSPEAISPASQTVPSTNERVSPPIQPVSHSLTNQTALGIPAQQLKSQISTTQTASEIPTDLRNSHLYTSQTASERSTNETPSVTTYKTSISTNDVNSQIPINHHVPNVTTASANIQEKPSVSTLPFQTRLITATTATPVTRVTPVTSATLKTETSVITETPVTTETPVMTEITVTTETILVTTTTPTYSRYSKYQFKKVESLDIASMIAAMYSGNEKKIIHIDEQPPKTTSYTQSTITDTASIATGNTLPTESSRAVEPTSPTATRLTSAPSRYASRYQTESKSQLHLDDQPSKTTYSTHYTTTHAASTTAGNTSLPESSRAAEPITSTYRYASRYQTESKSPPTTEQNENQNQQNVFNKCEQTNRPEPENLVRQYRYTGMYSRYNNQATSSITTPAVTTTATAISGATSTYTPVESLNTRPRVTSTSAPTESTRSSIQSTLRHAESIHTRSSVELPANESPSISYGSQRVVLKDATSPMQTSPMNVIEKSKESMQQVPARPNRYGLYSRYSALSNSSDTTASTSIVTDIPKAAENSSSNSSPSMGEVNITTTVNQTKHLTESVPAPEQVTSAKLAQQNEEPTKESQLKPSRSRMRSRFTDGVNRRHTIEIGKEAIQSALKLYSKDEAEPVRQTALDPISESPVTTHTPVYIPYHSRLTDSSSKVGGSTNGTIPALVSSAEPLEASEIKDTIISYKIKASGVTTKIIPTSLEVIQEKSHFDQSQTPKAASDISPAPATPPSPTLLSLSPDEVAQKIKLREIARKKKERWRHMTIH
ncbi:unnamed protein product [Candidula unifasciata]|uniref:RING-type domain-containing protein n=1 Tax=Candidula unifasciata TaxID=100452 RepID=A0A8S3ZV66_9EUPU|nr:unnamed protein product [Candidula unifasciata]